MPNIVTKNLLHVFMITLAFLASCSPFTKVYSEVEPGVNLYQYRTFNWPDMTADQPSNKGPMWLNATTQQWIKTSVESQMARFGFKTCTEKPDIILHYHVVVENEVYFIEDWWCDEPTGSDYGRCHRLRPINYQEGTLILDFIDGKTGNQIWRGAVSGILENIPQEALKNKIEAGVKAIFSKFPEKPIPFASLNQ
jgi:hypothetical protein